MTSEQIFNFVQQGGAYCAPLLLLGLWWLLGEYRRVQNENKEKDADIKQLATQITTVATELKIYLFNERKPS